MSYIKQVIDIFSGTNNSSIGMLSLYGQYFAKNYGLVGDGTTDDTAAFQAMIDDVSNKGGGIIYFEAKTYLIAGALQDTSLSNSQIKLPAVALTSQMITITLMGVQSPPLQFFIWNDLPITNSYTAFKTTLTGATGTASVFSGPYSSTIDPTQNNVQLNLINLVCIAPPNPSFTFFNLKYQQANTTQNVLIYAGTTNGYNVTQPTNTNAYGYKFPDENHTPNTIIDNLRIMGFYWGMQMSESIFAKGVRISSCYKAIDCVFGYHISVFYDLAVYGCAYGICSSASRNDNKNRLRVIGYGMEHAPSNKGWLQNIADIYDPNNYLLGDLVYVSVLGGFGNTSNAASFVKNGGANFLCTPLGSIAYGATTVAPAYSSSTTISSTVIAVTFSKAVKAVDFTKGFVITVNGSPATITAATRQTNTAIVYFNISTSMVGSDAVQVSYTALNGNVTDAAGVELGDIAATNVLNSIGTTYLHNSQFTAANGTNLTAYTPDIGNVWTPVSGSALQIQNNTLVGLTDGGTGYKAFVDIGNQNYTATAVVTKGAASNDVFLYCKATDANNVVAILFSGAQLMQVYNVVAGTTTQVGSNVNVSSDTSQHTYKIIVSGTSLTVQRDGTTLTTVTVSSSLTGTKSGVGFTGASSNCDYFTAS